MLFRLHKIDCPLNNNFISHLYFSHSVEFLKTSKFNHLVLQTPHKEGSHEEGSIQNRPGITLGEIPCHFDERVLNFARLFPFHQAWNICRRPHIEIHLCGIWNSFRAFPIFQPGPKLFGADPTLRNNYPIAIAKPKRKDCYRRFPDNRAKLRRKHR